MMGVVDAVLPALQRLAVDIRVLQRIAEHAERRNRDIAIANRLAQRLPSSADPGRSSSARRRARNFRNPCGRIF